MDLNVISPLVVHHVPVDRIIHHGDRRDLLHFNASFVVGSIDLKSILSIPLLLYAPKFAYPREFCWYDSQVLKCRL